jgi:hypothetical protein
VGWRGGGLESAEANERVAERGELTDELRLPAAVGVPPLLGREVPAPRPPLTLAPVEDDGDVRLGRELPGQVREQLGLVAVDDEEVLGHKISM